MLQDRKEFRENQLKLWKENLKHIEKQPKYKKYEKDFELQ